MPRIPVFLNYEFEPGILFILDLGNDFTLGAPISVCRPMNELSLMLLKAWEKHINMSTKGEKRGFSGRLAHWMVCKLLKRKGYYLLFLGAKSRSGRTLRYFTKSRSVVKTCQLRRWATAQIRKSTGDPAMPRVRHALFMRAASS